MARFDIAYTSYIRPDLRGYFSGASLDASFDIAYKKYILPNEGGYANLKNDKGGETYAGIARNYNPTWPGWTFIDFEKKRLGSEPKNNTKWPTVQYLVDQFYLDRWNAHRFGDIVSQDVANLLYDFHVHSQSSAIKVIQKLMGVTADGAMGPATIAAINKMNAAKLHDSLVNARRQFLNALIDKNPTQEGFRDGWMKRLAKFPVLLKQVQDSGLLTPILIVAGIGAAAVVFMQVNKKEKVKELQIAA